MAARGGSAKSEEKKDESKGGYKVVAPLIAVKVGSQVLQYSAGDILPGGVEEDSIEHLTDLGFIAES